MFGVERRRAARALAGLQQRLDAADPQALPVQQALWLIDFTDWLRRGPPPDRLEAAIGAPAADAADSADTPPELRRLRVALALLAQQPAREQAVGAVLAGLLAYTDPTLLLADFGFTARPAFFSELVERLRRKLLPATPETRDLAELFALLFPSADDEAWLAALDADLLSRIAALLCTGAQARAAPAAAPSDAPADPGPDPDAPLTATDPTPPPCAQQRQRWRASVLDALGFTVTQISATGFSPDLRTRMADDADLALDATAPFRQLPIAFASLRPELEALAAEPAAAAPPPADAAEAIDDAAPPLLDASQPEDAEGDPLRPALALFRAALDACRQRAESVTEHLDLHGTSVSLVFVLHQLRRRVARAEALLSLLLDPEPARPTALLAAELARQGAHRRSVRELLRQNTALLAEKMVERHAETGEHYITRDAREYRGMLGAAAGGGLVMAFTTWIKLGILTLPLALFWGGLAAGLNYAVSFVIVQLLHWTIATKQPAMTAPAMADKLRDLGRPGAVEAFVDEVANLTRSQSAGVFGNVALVMPVALLLGLAGMAVFGPHFMPAERAEHELHSLSLLGPTPLFAAFTGVLLFASSVIAGWVENAFVLHRLDSAIEWNPRIRRLLGAARAARWARWWRKNIGVTAGNVSLGLLLGLAPAFFQVFGVPLEVRHVTLSSGLFGAACASLGPAVVNDPAFWWALAGIAVNGVLNVGVSFYLAYRLALRARGIRVRDRQAIYRAIAARLLRRPLSFILPPRLRPGV
ncbi:site-specific recombinase Gcr [Thiomonas sp.]|uniref:site-specific recombinase n=1 Tax=Thiomonas sp. TaxID=2047785 RepID=UPI002633CE39|nr:site-specific recombinase Gcr [Thiomonas sp.]